MNQKIFLPVAIGTIILFLILQSNISVFGQQEMQVKTKRQKLTQT
jgi:hypothetical protein